MTAPDVFLETQFAGWKGRLKRSLMAVAYRRLDAIHTVTEDARRNFLEFFPELSQQRIHSIHHGVDTEYFQSVPARALADIVSVDAGRPVLGFFGRFMRQKGFRYLVHAMAKIVEEKRLDALPLVVTFAMACTR